MNGAILYILLIFTDVDGLDIQQTYQISGMSMEQCEERGSRLAESFINVNDKLFKLLFESNVDIANWECRNDNKYSL